MIEQEDKNLSLLLAQGDEKAFELIFRKYYQPLCVYSSDLLNDEKLAEEVVQDVFVKIWEKRFSLSIDSSLKHYLFRASRNHCLNQLQHKKIKNQYTQKVIKDTEHKINPEEYFLEPDLKKKIEDAINSLPPKRKEIFRLSREEGLKYKEIAEQLNISMKTVETQMGFALKFLRKKLKDYDDTFSILLFIMENTHTD